MGNTQHQTTAYLDAVASVAAEDIRRGESREDAIDYAFGVVKPSEYYPPLAADAVANSTPSDIERKAVRERVRVLLTLGRRIDDDR